MTHISIDIETFSDVDLAKSSVYRYAESPDFEILLFGYSVDGNPVQVVDLTCGEQIPKDIQDALTDEQVIKSSFNAAFERICLSRYLGLPTGEYLDPAQWRCSMVWSAYLGLPMSLKEVGAALGLDKQKLSEGKDLIRYFCQPNKAGVRNRPEDTPEKWARFKAYNIRDVEVETEIQARLQPFPVPDDVWAQYRQDQEINDCGIGIDMTLVKSAIAMDERSRQELNHKMQELTHLDNPNSVHQMKQWLANHGLETDTLGKKQVAELLQTAPEPLKTPLTLRTQLAKSSVKKYTAMQNVVCQDGRARGCFQFYGARTGRWCSKKIQIQNLPQNKLPDLAQARALVRQGDYEAVQMLYDSVPDILSQLIRTAFVPREGCTYFVADFSAIEARVIAWLANEEWRMELFRQGGDIYCQSASQMFAVPVVKHGVNGHLRQKGKIAELACIAQGQLVLTDHGEKPIETVTTNDRVWDGENWVRHDGVIYKGIREVITYDGLTATPDHLVWVEGQQKPIQFGIAAASGAHLLQTGDCGRAIRLGTRYLARETMEQEHEPLLCSDSLRGMRHSSVAVIGQPESRQIQRLSVLLPTKENPILAGQTFDRGEAALRKPQLTRLQELWSARNSVSIPQCSGCGMLSYWPIRKARPQHGTGSNRYKRALRAGKFAFSASRAEPSKPQKHSPERIRSEVLAICSKRGGKEAVSRAVPRRDYSRCGECGVREAKELENHLRTARLYDLRNAGPHHRFTVQGRLVHNCGYGGSVGALKAMGALEMGLTEDELPTLVKQWRGANPNIVRLWWDVDDAVKIAIKDRIPTQTHGIRFAVKSGILFVTLPSDRALSYVKPRIGENRFGGEAITYMGLNPAHQWARLESYGPKFVENIVQAISRDVLCYAMQTLRDCAIVAHVHDELIIEATPDMSLEDVCKKMSRTPPWAEGLLLRADGYVTPFYKKDC